MDFKSGWKTTEFWVTACVVLATVAGWIGGKLDGNGAIIASAVASGLYATSRGLAKGKPADAQLTQQVADAIAPLSLKKPIDPSNN